MSEVYAYLDMTNHKMVSCYGTIKEGVTQNIKIINVTALMHCVLIVLLFNRLIVFIVTLNIYIFILCQSTEYIKLQNQQNKSLPFVNDLFCCFII